MIRDILTKNENVKPNSKEMAVLRENFPSCFHADGSFDLGRFKEFLTDEITVTNEGYELKFLGKNYAKMLASQDSTTVIVPDTEHNALPENKNSQNVYISGDNLDALQHLLQSYSGKVKCIYIDPPYNTGSDGFVYNDKFNFTVEELSQKLSIDEDQASRILDLTKRGSASHSAWLMFIYPRLLLARDLLTDDGVIFISIDDNEQSNLKLMCDDIFGEENFVNHFSWVSNITGRQISGYGAAKTWESVLLYAKKAQETNSLIVDCTRAKQQMPDAYKGFNKDIRTDEYGKYAIGDTLYNHNRKFNEETRPNLVFSIFFNPDTEEIRTGEIGDIKPGFVELKPHKNGDGMHQYHAWRWSREKIVNEFYNLIVLQNGKGGYEIYTRIRDFNHTTLKDIITNIKNGDSELEKLFDKKVFEYPKPTELIKLFLMSNDDDTGIILDFFSGSATTAHAVLQSNTEDNKSRQFIMVQLPEAVAKGSNAQKAGYQTIDQIGIDRIKRAACKIREENPGTTTDLGFKHYTLQEPSAETIDKIIDFDPNRALVASDILSEFGVETVLATWMVKDGYGFSSPQTVDLKDYTAYYCDKHLYIISPNLSNAAISELIYKLDSDKSLNPETIVVFGYSLNYTEMNALKTNLSKLKSTSTNRGFNFDIRY